MKKLYLMFLIMLVASSCALFKRSTKTVNKDRDKTNSLVKLETSAETNSIKNAKRMRYRDNTMQAGYSIQFWPKGKLTFLPTGGFTGEFDSVLLNGNVNEMAKTTEIMVANEVEKTNLMLATENKKSADLAKSVTTTKTFLDIKVIVIGVVLLALLLIYWFKR